MIKLTYEQLNNVVFVEALKKLVNTPFHLKLAYHLGRIQDKVMSESKAAQTAYRKLLDERVEWLPQEPGENPMHKQPKDPKQIQELEKEFLAIEFEIDRKPVHVQDIHIAKLSPLEFMAALPILTGLETLEDEPEAEKPVTPLKSV